MTRRRKAPPTLARAELIAITRLRAIVAAAERELGRRLEPLALELPPAPRKPPVWPFKVEDAAYAAGLVNELHTAPPKAEALARDVIAFALELEDT